MVRELLIELANRNRSIEPIVVVSQNEVYLYDTKRSSYFAKKSTWFPAYVTTDENYLSKTIYLKTYIFLYLKIKNIYIIIYCFLSIFSFWIRAQRLVVQMRWDVSSTRYRILNKKTRNFCIV